MLAVLAFDVATVAAHAATPLLEITTYQTIERIEVDVDPPAIDLLLTEEGLRLAGTCDGAASIATDVVARYPDVPGATGDIAWAEQRMIWEIYGHGRAAAGTPFPGITERANPISIVFAHYTDPTLIVRDRGAWLAQRAYATLYRAECASET